MGAKCLRERDLSASQRGERESPRAAVVHNEMFGVQNERRGPRVRERIEAIAADELSGVARDKVANERGDGVHMVVEGEVSGLEQM